MVQYGQIIAVANRIAELFKPQKIILFGSYAYGTPTNDSDVDLMVIMNYRGREMAKALEILRAVRPQFSMDLIVRRPADCSRRYREFDPLIRESFDRGKVIYEHDAKRVDRKSRRRLSRRAHLEPATQK